MALGDNNISASCTVYLVISIIIATIIWVFSYTTGWWHGWPLLIDDFDAENDPLDTVRKIARLQSRIFWIILIMVCFIAMNILEKDIELWDPLYKLFDLLFIEINRSEAWGHLGNNFLAIFILLVQLVGVIVGFVV